LCHEVAFQFFATKEPDPPHWTLNSCFGEFCTIWVHLGPFGCLTKLGAKRAELVQNFVPRSRIGIFATNATDPPHWKPYCFGAFHTIWVHLGPLGCLTKLGAKRVELVQKYGTRSRIGIFRNERTGSTSLDPKLMFCCVSYHLGALSRIGIFRNERTRSTPLDPKLMFCCISYYLGAFGTVWLPYETRCITGRTSAKACATKLHLNFSQRTHPIHPIGL